MQIVRIGGESIGKHSADTVGAKAANLVRMAALGLPVPPAFVLPIELCAAILRGETAAKQALCDGLTDGVRFLEQTTGKRLGDRRQPLLVSVRSSAAQSMPGDAGNGTRRRLYIGCSTRPRAHDRQPAVR